MPEILILKVDDGTDLALSNIAFRDQLREHYRNILPQIDEIRYRRRMVDFVEDLGWLGKA